MNIEDLPPNLLTVRAGCKLVYEVQQPTAIVLLFHPYLTPAQLVLQESIVFGNGEPFEQFNDAHGNTLYKTMLLPGLNEYHYDALLSVFDVPDNTGLPDHFIAASQIPPEIIRYTLPSRYCESDKLTDLAHQHFGHLPAGLAQVQAICNWTHNHIEYRYGSGSTLLSACDIIERGYGVCRDFAHVMIALCRALDIPARYVAGHMPYLGISEGDIGVDFHAYCEIYLGGYWHVYDARYNKPHRGRIKIAHGMDAVDTAFATIFGNATQVKFQVWAYRVDQNYYQLTTPIALTKDESGKAMLQI